ncbi:MAG: SGNH/GDSL hydrolase family protein [Microbacteriaceae bacterium]|nr:SGNH/GDSL hydrolase family protein [Microbacteriaceae bacterium]
MKPHAKPIIFAKTVRTSVALIVVTGVLSGCATVSASAKHSSPDLTPPPLVVSVGDSIMKGNGLIPEEAWPALISRTDGFSGMNLACNGEGFVAPGDPLDCNGPFGDLATRVALLHPTTLLISGSSNDFGIDNPTLLAATVSALANSRRALPTTQIIALSTVWGDTPPPAQLADVDQQVRDATLRVRGVFVDIGQPLMGHPEWLQADDVHPTAEGQQHLAAAISAALAARNISLGEK